MTRDEFRALQALTGLRNIDIARHLGVNKETVSRWRKYGCAHGPMVRLALLAVYHRLDRRIEA
jgi:transposase-like protein